MTETICYSFLELETMSTKCEICVVNLHKYTCPRCSLKSCSLDCCRKHKLDTGCTGQRDKTKFIKKDEFNEMELLNDYKFLEEQYNMIDAAQRTAQQLDTVDPIQTTVHTGFFENLRKFVAAELKINLKLMPLQATRHLANKTRFNRNTKEVSWSLELIFHLNDRNGDKNLLKLNTNKNLFSSKDTLHNVLSKFYQKYKSDLFETPSSKSKSDTTASSNSIALYTEFNSVFEAECFNDENIHVLQQIDDFEKKKKYFIKLDLNDTLEAVLRHKTIIEYPAFFIVKPNDLKEYSIQEETPNSQEKNISSKSPQISNKNKLEDGECNTDDSEGEDDQVKNAKRANYFDENVNKKLKSNGEEIVLTNKLENVEDGEIDD